MELTYHRNGNYLFPNLILENEAEEPVGKYGLLRKQYLKEHKTNWYKSMLLTGKLDRHLAEIDRSAQERVDRIMDDLSKTNPAPGKEISPCRSGSTERRSMKRCSVRNSSGITR